MTNKDLNDQADIDNILPLRIDDSLSALDLFEETVKRLRQIEAIADAFAQQRDRAQDQFIFWTMCDLANQSIAFQKRLHTDLTQMMNEQRGAASEDTK